MAVKEETKPEAPVKEEPKQAVKPEPQTEVKPETKQDDKKKEEKTATMPPASDSPKEPKPETKPAAELPTPKSDEKIFNISLRKAFRKSQKKRADYATSLVRDFLKRHLKSNDVKFGEHLNKKIWEGGNKIPRNVRVKTFFADGVAKAELMGFEYKDFKAMPKQEKVGMKDKLMGRLGPKAMQKQKEEEMVKGEKTKAPEKPQRVERHAMEEE